jgi:hypothetical protein
MPIAERSRQKSSVRKGRINRRQIKKAKTRHAFSWGEKQFAAKNNDAFFLQVIKEAGYQAALRGTANMGFIVASEDNYVVKQYPDGSTIRISKIEKVSIPEKIILD